MRLLALGLAACVFAADASAVQRRYFYEEIFQPLYAKDPARPGVFQSNRPNLPKAQFLMPKPARAYRAFIVGGSIAALYGQGHGEDLRAALQRVLPERKVEAF